jgi:hypothetical protein
MMKKLFAILALVTVTAFGAAVVEANQCPLLIKQLNEGIAKMSDQAKADEAKKLTAEADALHKAGKHAESVAKCDEAAKVAGIELKKK